MDVRFLYRGDRFLWNQEKAIANQRKHGIRFEHACQALFDPQVLIEDATSNAEQRSAAIGRDHGMSTLFVVYQDQGDDSIRIISARKATRPEERRFEIKYGAT